MDEGGRNQRSLASTSELPLGQTSEGSGPPHSIEELKSIHRTITETGTTLKNLERMYSSSKVKTVLERKGLSLQTLRDLLHFDPGTCDEDELDCLPDHIRLEDLKNLDSESRTRLQEPEKTIASLLSKNTMLSFQTRGQKSLKVLLDQVSRELAKPVAVDSIEDVAHNVKPER